MRKRVDESWKERAEREKQRAPESARPQPSPDSSAAPPSKAAAPRHEEEGSAQARFDLFVSGLAMEALASLGELPHPTTRRHATNLPQAKYLIDLLGVLEEKTKGNLTAEEERLLTDTLYQLRMRYLTKSGGA